MTYETVVGLEVHVQLATRTKLFCSCPVGFGAPQNTNVCPVCLGLPGVLPVVNRAAVASAVRAALALGCRVNSRTKFDRKGYYYPDLPKNYQISQYDEPVGRDGRLDFELDGQVRRVRIRRVHLEEDAGKLVHSPDGRASLVDLNRAGVALIEVVSEPELRSGAEARAYLEALRQVLRYLGVSECNMEEGSMRCEPNISVRPVGASSLGTKTEVKNLNSFRAVEEAVEFEAERHVRILESGGAVAQETMLWDEERGRTRAMRSKEEAHDYRYFPEPDLPPIELSPEWLRELAASVGELPAARRARFASGYGLSEYDATVLTAEKAVADYFEEVVRSGGSPKAAANWVSQDILRAVNEKRLPIGELGVSPGALAELIGLVNSGAVDLTVARSRVLPLMLGTGRRAAEVVQAEGLAMVSDRSELEELVRKVVDENPRPLADVKKNPRAAMKYLGLVRQASGGKADVRIVREIVKKIVKDRAGVEVDL